MAAITGSDLVIGAISTAYSATVPEDYVISQNPAAGTSVVQSSAVDLVISLGSVVVTVPDVTGETQTAALTAIIEAGLTLGTVSTENNEAVPADHIISQTPAAGSSVQKGTAVDLVISIRPSLPPDAAFSAGSATINYGQSTDLFWITTGGQGVSIDNGIGSVVLNGSVTVAPLHTTTYTLTVTGPGGTTGKAVTISVHAAVEPQPEGSFGENYEDLVPPDATIGQYDPKRFSLIPVWCMT